MDISIPVNTTATVFVTAKSGTEIMESSQPANKAKGVEFLREIDGQSVFKVDSGNYKFQSIIN